MKAVPTSKSLLSDNPRTENPEQIFTDVKNGFIKSDDYFFEPDREKELKLNNKKTNLSKPIKSHLSNFYNLHINYNII